MHLRPTLLAALLAGAAAACAPAASGAPPSDAGAFGPPTAATPGSPSAGPRPSSTASLTVVSPTNGSTVSGSTVHVEVRLVGATIVSTTTTDIRPDRGHIHLYIDNNLVSMNYGASIDEPVPPGTHVLRAEFVASDHAPFNPRVVTPDVVFVVKP